MSDDEQPKVEDAVFTDDKLLRKRMDLPGTRRGNRWCRKTTKQGMGGNIRKYGLNMSRQTFREYAIDIGFKKYS